MAAFESAVDSIAVLARTDILSCDPTMSVARAATLMRERGCGSIVVVEDAQAVGIWTEHDAARTDFADPAAFDVPIASVMSAPLRTIASSAGVADAAYLFQHVGIRHLVVVDDAGTMVGVLSQTDLALRYGVEHFLRLRTVSESVAGPCLRLSGSLKIGDAARRLVEGERDAAVVDLADGTLGIITERDLVGIVARRQGGGVLEDAASRPLRTVSSDAPLLEARRLLSDLGFRHLGVTDGDGAVVGVLSMRDILDVVQRDYVAGLADALKERDVQLLRSQEELFLARQVIQSSANAVMVVGGDGTIEGVNPAFTRLTGLSAEAAKGRTPDLLMRCERRSPNFFATLPTQVGPDGSWRGNVWCSDPDGAPRAYAMSVHAMASDGIGSGRYAAVFYDATKSIEADEERRIASIAFDTVSPMMLTDANARIVRVNPAFTRMTGYSAEEVIGQTPAILKSGQHGKEFYDQLWRELLENGSWQGEVVNRRRDGEIYLEWLTINAVTAESGQPTHYVGTLLDITERRRAQDTLREERDLIAAGPSVVFKWRPVEGWPVAYVSPNVQRVFGYRPEDLMGGQPPFATLLHPDDLARVESEVSEHLAAGAPTYEQSYRLRHADGTWRWVDDFSSVVRDAVGDVITINGYILDVTTRMAAEAALRNERQRLENIIQGTSVGTWEWNVQTGQAIFNERWAEIVGYTLSELSPVTIDTWTRLAHPDDLAHSGDLLNRHLRGEVDHYECEARVRHKDGHWVWVLDRGKVVSWTPDGQPEWMAGTHWDITERKRAEETLEQNQQQLDRVLGAVNEGWWEFDKAKDATVYSARWWQILGYAENELPATTDLWHRLLHPDDVARVNAFVQDVLASGQEKFELVFRQKHKDGHYITVLSRGSVQRDAEGRLLRISGSNNDVTARVQLEEALRQSEERYRLAQTASGVGIWDWDLVSGQVTWDATCWTMLGYDLEGRLLTYEEWASNLHPDDRENTVAAVQAQLAKGGTFVVEFRTRRADGGWQWLQGRGRVVARATDGTPTRMMGTHTDVGARRRIDEALHRSNAELEQFAYVASHDLRQPLRMVNSYTQLLERTLADRLDDTSREFMGFVREGAQRMDQMLVSLLEYSRIGRQGEPMTTIDSRVLAEEAVLFLNPAIVEAGAEITLTGDWPTVVASRNEGVRLFQNLIGNAVKYRAADRPPVVQLDVHRDGKEWVFQVRDNGIGIDPKQFDRLFKVFQRLHTRESYEGSGIGLAVCRKIVERHGGRIWVESDGPDKGSAFCFTLPDAPTGGEDR